MNDLTRSRYVLNMRRLRTVSEPTEVHSPIATPMPAESAPAEPSEPSPAFEDVLFRQPTPSSDQRPPERQPTFPATERQPTIPRDVELRAKLYLSRLSKRELRDSLPSSSKRSQQRRQ